ncbi:MAG: hypothetical protein HY800_00665 [Ignavibacteriales bacterium]|nr:hypothetical protein [Ignavibacteriales bacterium]
MRNRLLFLKLSAKRFTKFVGNLYFFSVLVLKGLFWTITAPHLVKAVIVGIKDYFGRRFYEGSGFQFLNNQKVMKQNQDYQ